MTLPVIWAQVSVDLFLALGSSGRDVVAIEKVFVLKEKLLGLLSDASQSQEADDAHPRGN